MAYSPRTGFFYATAADRPQSRIAQGTGKSVGPAIGAKYGGTLTALDARTNKIAWQKRMPYSIGQGSGSLVTASDLLFHGEPDGNLQAYDARTGELLWQWQTGAGADAPAVTYEIDGIQYVAVAAGGVSIQTTSANGDMIWAFSLSGSPGDRLRPFAAPKPPDTVVGFVGPVVKADTIHLEDYRFNPARITVATGTKVTFSNSGGEPHNAASSDGGGWDTGLLAHGESATVTFNQPGTYSFSCTPHPSMIGQVIVSGPALASVPATVVNAAAPSGATTISTMPAGHGAH
jgi:alcohol dehydrogenase (cytochrome c)